MNLLFFADKSLLRIPKDQWEEACTSDGNLNCAAMVKREVSDDSLWIIPRPKIRRSWDATNPTIYDRVGYFIVIVHVS